MAKRRKCKEDIRAFQRLNQKVVKRRLEEFAEDGLLAKEVARLLSSSRVCVNEADINALYKSMGYPGGWGGYVLDLQKYAMAESREIPIISRRGRGLYCNIGRKRIGACFDRGGSPSQGYSTIPSPSSS